MLYDESSSVTHALLLPSSSAIRPIRRIEANARGRDFVVGDLHGCRKPLDRLLMAVDFEPEEDRLFSVGDLVDRGPESRDCLALLREPWFHAVMGNHEELLLQYFKPWLEHAVPVRPRSPAGLGLMLNGGDWAFRETGRGGRPGETLGELLRALVELPLVISVGTGPRRFHVVHADLARAAGARIWTDAELDALPEQSSAPGADWHGFRWSRALFGIPVSGRPRWAAGLSDTFCGHTMGTGVRAALSHVCLDTGAFMAQRRNAKAGHYGLTLADVQQRRYLTLRKFGIEEGEW